MEHIHLYEEPEFDAETQERLDSQVDKLLKGYDWTLAPLANKYVTFPDQVDTQRTSVVKLPVKHGNFTKIGRESHSFSL